MSGADSERLARLEERLAWFERHVTEQDKVILELADKLERLKVEVMRLRDLPQGGTPSAPSDEERPPHY